MTKRVQFLAVKKGKSAARPGVVVQARASDATDVANAPRAQTPGQTHGQTGPCPAPRDTGEYRVGYTASRKVGNAVTRNRAKRRLREIVRLIAATHCRAGTDYVFIARATTATRPWAALLDDVKQALNRLHQSPL